MRSFHRQCRLLLALDTQVVLVFVMLLAVSVLMCWRLVDFLEVDPAPFITNFRLIQGLTVGCLLWSILVLKRIIAPDTGKGLVLASFGVHCRLITDIILYGLNWDYSTFARARPLTDLSFPGVEQLRRLHTLLDYGGLFAYVMGFALVLLATRTIRYGLK